MTPSELAAEVDRIVHQCMDRVGPESIGAKQYHVEGQPQKFETMPFAGLIEYFKEELLDQVNYAVMSMIRLDRIRESFIARLEAETPYADSGYVIVTRDRLRRLIQVADHAVLHGTDAAKYALREGDTDMPDDPD